MIIDEAREANLVAFREAMLLRLKFGVLADWREQSSGGLFEWLDRQVSELAVDQQLLAKDGANSVRCLEVRRRCVEIANYTFMLWDLMIQREMEAADDGETLSKTSGV